MSKLESALVPTHLEIRTIWSSFRYHGLIICILQDKMHRNGEVLNVNLNKQLITWWWSCMEMSPRADGLPTSAASKQSKMLAQALKTATFSFDCRASSFSKPPHSSIITHSFALSPVLLAICMNEDGKECDPSERWITHVMHDFNPARHIWEYLWIQPSSVSSTLPVHERRWLSCF